VRYGRLEPNVTHTWFVRWMTNRDEGELQKSFRSLDAAMQEAQLLQREHGPMPNAYIFVEHGRRPNRVTDLLARFKGSWGFVASSPEADQWRWDHQERFSSMTVPSPSETATDVLGGDVLPPGFEGFESNRRRYSVNARDSVAAAREMRRKFHDKEPEHETAVPWDWPDELQEIGTCEAVRLRQTHEELINFLDSCFSCFAMRLHPERSSLPPGTRRLKLDKRTNAAIESAKRSEACSAARACPEPSLDKRSGKRCER